ncbi:MAG: hypothetical protein MUD01_18815 [Chloroflexaceae bacterium]|nr:hypothetical protein [Chloroflexaceae bacterium]
MATPPRVEPWLILSIPQGTALQLAGMLGSVVLAREAARRAQGGRNWLLASRLLAYFTEHALAHWLVGRLGGIRFSGYGLHGTSHPHLYPPGLRFFFSHMPFLSARIEPASLPAASPAARAAMYAAGTVSTVLVSLAIPLYGLRHDVPGSKALLIGNGLWLIPLLLSEGLRTNGDLRRAVRAVRSGQPTPVSS